MIVRAILAGKRTAIRNALKMVIEAATEVVVVGEAMTGRGLADLWDRLRPDLIVIDATSRGFEGFRIFAGRPTAIVLISDVTDRAISATQTTPVAIVDANSPVSELTAAIRGVLASTGSS